MISNNQIFRNRHDQESHCRTAFLGLLAAPVAARREFELAEKIAREVRADSQYYSEQRIAMMAYAMLILRKKPEAIKAAISKAEEADRFRVALGEQKKPRRFKPIHGVSPVATLCKRTCSHGPASGMRP